MLENDIIIHPFIIPIIPDTILAPFYQAFNLIFQIKHVCHWPVNVGSFYANWTHLHDLDKNFFVIRNFSDGFSLVIKCVFLYNSIYYFSRRVEPKIYKAEWLVPINVIIKSDIIIVSRLSAYQWRFFMKVKWNVFNRKKSKFEIVSDPTSDQIYSTLCYQFMSKTLTHAQLFVHSNWSNLVFLKNLF